MEFKIDTEFKEQLPPLDSETRAQLESNLIADGCLNPLIVWKEEGILIDGHHRYEICEANGIEYEVKEVSFKDRSYAQDWIYSHQIGKRPADQALIKWMRGERYNIKKKRHGGDRKSSGQFGYLKKTVQSVAEEHGVSPRTIQRDGVLADRVAEISEATGRPKVKCVSDAMEEIREENKLKRAAKIRTVKNKEVNKVTNAKQYIDICLSHLWRIRKDDPNRVKEINRLISEAEKERDRNE